MEKSDHYFIRRERMKNLQSPTITEIKRELGEALSEAMFKHCPDALKPSIGLTPNIRPPADLWISPSDTLIGKVCLKPPLTSKHMKALTHEGILMIGRDIEQKFWNKAELDKIKALEEQEEMLLFIAELEKRKAVAIARKQEQQICREEKRQMRIEFEERLSYELEHLERRLKEEYDELMRQKEEELDQQWQEKLEAAVAETVDRLTEQFLADLAKQEGELLKKFSVEMKKEEIKRQMEVKAVQDCCQDTFLQLKHQLECKNVANIMYILCMERKKCQSERETLLADHQTQLQHLQTLLTENEVATSKLKLDYEQKARQVHLREECVLEILRQFQKFINFALRASPAQAEFLLSIEKMMMFELAEAVVKTDRKHAKRLAKMLFPWKHDHDKLEGHSKTAVASKEALIPHDHHQCNNEIEPPISDHSLKSNDYLPAFHYDKFMYVREDFRNMMSQGIEVSPSNLIWNRDVEHLMRELKRSVTSLEEDKRKEEEEAAENEEDEEMLDDVKINKRRRTSEEESVSHDEQRQSSQAKPPRRSIVYFRQSKDDGHFLFPIFGSDTNELSEVDASEIFNELSIDAKQSSDDINMVVEKDCCKPCNIARYIDRELDRDSPMPLIGTRNSVDILKEASRLSSPHVAISNDHYEGGGILCAQDSLHKHRMSLKPAANKVLLSRESLIPTDTIILRKKSKQTISSTSVSARSSGSPKKRSSSNSRISKGILFKDLQRHAHLESQLSFRESSTTIKHPHLNGNPDDVERLSKLSLTRNSYIVQKHRQSILVKPHSQSQTRPSQTEKSRELNSSQQTIQLTKPIKPILLPDAPDRASLKKSKNRDSYERKSITYSLISDTDVSRELLPVPLSKLTMSRDSLDLLRSPSRVSEASRSKRRTESKESVEIKDGILGVHIEGARLSPPIIKLYDDGSKAVKMSHIEIVPLDSFQTHFDDEIEEKPSVTCSVFKEDVAPTKDSPWLVYHDKEKPKKDVKKKPTKSRDNFLLKPNEAKIMGDEKATEHLQKAKEFTIHRASSLLSIFRKHPSLVKIFTSCTK